MRSSAGRRSTLSARTSPTAGARSSRTAWRALLAPLGHTANVWIETISLMGHIGVMLAFLLIVLHSKHLHIGLAPINVTFKRLPNGLGPLLPVEYKGEPIDFEDPAEDAILGRGKIEDFTWKGYLDFTTCTECGRCQSQCPAWNTGKPLSPKLVIMNLRDHLFAKAPYIIGGKPMPNGENEAEQLVSTEGGFVESKHDEHHARPGIRLRAHHGLRSGAGDASAGRHRSSRAASSTPTCCGPAPPAAPASSSARWISSTSTTSSTCAATR